MVLQKGVAEKYYDGKVPLIVKLNGKTSLPKGEPISTQLCSVEYAVNLGAKGVGYTIYMGSAHENIMIKEFGRIHEEAISLEYRQLPGFILVVRRLRVIRLLRLWRMRRG